jgi:hypothetical protein
MEVGDWAPGRVKLIISDIDARSEGDGPERSASPTRSGCVPVGNGPVMLHHNLMRSRDSDRASVNSMGHVFVSYSRQDREYVRRLVAHLRAAGLDVWVDDEIHHGDKWLAVVTSMIDRCAAFIVVMSPAADQSDWVRRELTRAQGEKKPIFPILLEGKPLMQVNDLHFEIVGAGRMPGPAYVEMVSKVARQASLLALTRLEDLAGHSQSANPVAQREGPATGDEVTPHLRDRKVSFMTSVRRRLANRPTPPPAAASSLAISGVQDEALSAPAIAPAAGDLASLRLTSVVVPPIRTGIVERVVLPADVRPSRLQPAGGPGRVVAWGYDDYGQATVPAELVGRQDIKAIAAGSYHSLALHDDGRVTGWGSNQLGQANPRVRYDVVAIAAGGALNLALHDNGLVTAWGGNSSGQHSVPPTLTNVVAIAAGDYHCLALRDDGCVVAWGEDRSAQAGVASELTNVVGIAAGRAHSLALHDDGRVTAWGTNSSGQTRVPTALTDVTAVAAGSDYSLALHGSGRVTLWGGGGRKVPPPNGPLTEVVAIAAGAFHSLALHRNGDVTAWGENSHGQTAIPARLAPYFAAIAAGYYHSLALVHR